jgi:AcrB/AcrD/AcrF family
MKFSRFFIDRPIFAIVISVITVVLGGIAYFILPVAQFPTIAPPTVTDARLVTARRIRAKLGIEDSMPTNG